MCVTIWCIFNFLPTSEDPNEKQQINKIEKIVKLATEIKRLRNSDLMK